VEKDTLFRVINAAPALHDAQVALNVLIRRGSESLKALGDQDPAWGLVEKQQKELRERLAFVQEQAPKYGARVRRV
jgi:hypothetical protein